MDKYFEGIYRQYSDMVFRAAYKVLGDHHESEDVVIEVFCKLYLCLLANNDICNVPGWLRVTAGTTAIDIARKRRDIPAEPDLLAPAQNDFVDSLVVKCFTDDILRALYRKNEKWFTYICMRYLLEMKYEEIAAVEGTSADAVKHAIQRAKRFLKQRYPESQNICAPSFILFLVLSSDILF